MKLFVLGGNDAEMELVKRLLSMAGEKYVQPEKGWGNHEYSPNQLGVTRVEEELLDATPRSGQWHEYFLNGERLERVIFVECTPFGWEDCMRHGAEFSTVVVDHHGDLAHRPASILQILTLLEKDGFKISASTRRWVELVAANDSGYIPAMQWLGATQEEIDRVRLADRAAQGVTLEQEREAERAIEALEITRGGMIIVRPAHSKCATITDRLYTSGPENLLIVSEDGETNYFGDGAVCAVLKEKFEGWNGGSGLGKAGESAFWGGCASQKEVEAFLRNQFKK